jgi:DNA-binding transcriptional LysR family regulator
MPDQLAGMKVFAAVLAEKSFSAAGRRLGMSQTMVAKHINALESSLGVQLLLRSTRTIVATEAGQRYGEACKRIIEEVEEARAEALAQQAEPRGTLRLSVPVSFGYHAITPILGDFARAHPGLSIHLELNDRRVDPLGDGWDVAVRIGRLNDSALVARKLAPCPTVVCASPSYLGERGVPRRLADLADHDCLGYTLSDTTNDERWSFGTNSEISVGVSCTFRANNGDAICAMAAAGLGLAYQPAFVAADYLRRGELVVIDLEQPTSMLFICAMFPRAARQPAKVRAFVDFLVERWHWSAGADDPPAASKPAKA